MTEVDEQPITHEAGHEAVETLDDPNAGRLIVEDDLAKILRVELLCHFGGADHVAKHYRQVPALSLLPGSAECRLQARAAATAEPLPGLVAESAGGTGGRQRATALGTETSPFAIIRLAPGAGNRHRNPLNRPFRQRSAAPV